MSTIIFYAVYQSTSIQVYSSICIPVYMYSRILAYLYTDIQIYLVFSRLTHYNKEKDRRKYHGQNNNFR